MRIDPEPEEPDEEFYDDDDDGFEPCTNCKQPDACEDFGCAIDDGLEDLEPGDVGFM